MLAINLRASNGSYVCAEGGGGGRVVADRAMAKEWETFELIDQNSARLNNNDNVLIRTYNGHFVCAEGGGGREIVANRTVGSIWETFGIQKINPTSSVVNSGDQIALKAYNGQYMCAEGGGGREVVANRNAIGPWETFTISFAGQQPLRYTTGDVTVGAGKHMETWVLLQNDGLLITNTHIWTRVMFAGFHGACMVCMCDSSNNVIANGPLRLYGVDGRYMPGLASDRTVQEMDHFDPSIYDKTDHFQIFQQISPQSQLVKDIHIMAEVAKSLGEVATAFKAAIGVFA